MLEYSIVSLYPTSGLKQFTTTGLHNSKPTTKPNMVPITTPNIKLLIISKSLQIYFGL